MRLPAKDFTVKVGPFAWQVEYDAEIVQYGANGTTNPDIQRIKLDPQMPEQKQRQTFLHELLHAITYTTGLWRHEPPDEEQALWHLSMGLAQVIQDNPHIFGGGDGK